MAVSNWKVIYRDFTAVELDEEEVFFKKEARNIYLSQAVGSKNYQRSITTIEERLRAIKEIRREQGNQDYYEETYTDFSGENSLWSSQP
jgi:5'-deoxynucleotidase YfbR-like HD superfamily hydrolase